jgi:hypothetical protein
MPKAHRALHQTLSPDLAALRDALLHLTVAVPKPPTRITGLSDKALRARDAIILRARATVWHVSVIDREYAMANAYANRSPVAIISEMNDPDFLLGIRATLSHLLDDVVFNAMSMLDYLGFLLACVFDLSLEERHTWARTARRIAKASASAGAYPASIREKIADAHQEWVSGLDAFRGVLIHREVAPATATKTFHIEPLGCQLEFCLPRTLVAAIRPILPKEEKIGVPVGAEAICRAALVLSRDLVDTARKDLAPQ